MKTNNALQDLFEILNNLIYNNEVNFLFVTLCAFLVSKECALISILLRYYKRKIVNDLGMLKKIQNRTQ